MQLRAWMMEHAEAFGLAAGDLSDLIGQIDLDDMQDRIQAKDGARRFMLGIHAVADLLEAGPALVVGSDEERIASFETLITHSASTWRASMTLHGLGYYPLGAAVAIIALEETGKIAVERYRLAGVQGIDLSGLPAPQELGSRAKRASFFRHADKHVLAAMSGALINARLDRVLGVDYVNWFIASAESGSLERLRQRYLYAEKGENGPQVPSDLVDADGCARLVTLAGEVLAEVAGVVPEAWERLLSEVQTFEDSVGLASA